MPSPPPPAGEPLWHSCFDAVFRKSLGDPSVLTWRVRPSPGPELTVGDQFSNYYKNRSGERRGIERLGSQDRLHSLWGPV